jgi:hypothetical protein
MPRLQVCDIGSLLSEIGRKQESVWLVDKDLSVRREQHGREAKKTSTIRRCAFVIQTVEW